MPEIIKRSLLAEYLNTTPKGVLPTFTRIGFGVASKSVDYSPEVDERQFIDEDSPTSSIKRYTMSSDFDILAAKGSPIFEYLDMLRITRATYADAETEYCEVRLYEPVDGSDNIYGATKLRVAVSIASLGDAAEDPLTLSASIAGQGDPVQGTFNYATGTFTASTITP